jgi:hypothetical protein
MRPPSELSCRSQLGLRFLTSTARRFLRSPTDSPDEALFLSDGEAVDGFAFAVNLPLAVVNYLGTKKSSQYCSAVISAKGTSSL